MDYQRSRGSLLQESINRYRSTSDLIPKCRSEALKEKRAVIRSKINHLAKQIYELKYDQEWQSHKLQQLVKKGDCIFQEAEEKLKEVMDQSKLLGTLQSESSNQLSLQLTTMQLKGSTFAASERSTQPQVNEQYSNQKKEEAFCTEKKQGQKIESTISSKQEQKSSILTKSIRTSSQMTRSLKVIQAKSTLQPLKKHKDKKRISKENIINMSIFIALLTIVLLLL